MKITAVEPLVLGTSWRNLIFLKVSTDEGLVGFGECTIQNREEGVLGYLSGAVRRHVLGSDPFNVEDLWLRMYRNDFWRGGVIATTVMSGMEVACWDIIGKALGQPVWRLLGGQCHEKIKAYANAWYTVERTPQEFAKRVQVVLEKGYKALKVDPFGPGSMELSRAEKIRSVELVAAIREAVGPDVEIFVEMHGRFSAHTAIEIARLLEPFEPGWIEEPCPPEDIPSLQKVAAQVRIPVATGERYFTHHGFREVLESGAADILQPDVIHAGGILDMKKIAAMADARSMMLAPHNSNGPVCTAASVHFDFCTTNIKVQECFDDFSESWVVEAVPGTPRPQNGYFHLPQGPGLGISPNEDLIKEHPIQQRFFNMFEADWHMRQSKK
ncbi:MAG: mandelate racemase/muconate lactonizing enzyme family protein [Terriglobia bacterium]|jgi:galactonate dehydratase